MRTLKSIFIDQSFATITVSNELSFNFDLSSTIGIDLSRNLLHREIDTYRIFWTVGFGIPEFII